MKKKTLACTLAACLPLTASAVYLDLDGVGQALIFPYYTAQSYLGNPFNTYLSVVNHAADAKAVRVRVRESRNSREVASFNLYLSPNDMWTGAILPGAGSEAARLISNDTSCISPSPAGTPWSLSFKSTFYSGDFDDGNGPGLDRTHEGWVEVIEMATLTGASAAAVTHNTAAIPVNCAAVQGPAPPSVAAPTGGLSGTLTLINVANGSDFTTNAEALAELATRPFYRMPADPYPDFNALEIDAVSQVVAKGFSYRSVWNRPVDAVSAVFMRSAALSEFVLDSNTRSRSAMVVTFPTRQFYVGSSATQPFSSAAKWTPTCDLGSEALSFEHVSREEQVGGANSFGLPPSMLTTGMCVAAYAIDFNNGAAHMNTGKGSLLGTNSGGFLRTSITVESTFQNGWARMTQPTPGTLTSLATSTRVNLSTGATTTGSHVYSGLPMLGFMVRTFQNGTLACSSGTCQGNYGGSFPLKYRRAISPAN